MRICELMEQRGIQRIQLADAMGVSPSCITKWVQGTALPSADKLPRLAAVLQCSIDALYGSEPPGGGTGAASGERSYLGFAHRSSGRLAAGLRTIMTLTRCSAPR